VNIIDAIHSFKIHLLAQEHKNQELSC